MDGFADLLTDVFSDSSVPSFSDGDLDFENLNFDEKSEEDKAENPTTTNEAWLQEATPESEVLSDETTTDPLHTTANAHEEKTSDEENFMSQTPAGDYTSSEEECSSSGEDEEMDEGTSEEPGDLSPGCSRENLLDDKNEDSLFPEGQPVVSEGADDPNVCYKVQDEAESDEEVSYFGGIPEGEDETVMKGADEQEREEDSSDSEPEGMKIEQEENVHQLHSQTSNEIEPEEESLEFPSLSLQNLQDLITEVDGEEYVDKMTDFTEDEHQEAGESFADYPSDFSSGEYTRAEENKEENKLDAFPGPEQEACLEGAMTETPWRAEDTKKNEGFRDLEMNADEIKSLGEAAGEQDESQSESNSDSDDDEEELLRRSSELSDIMRVQDVENYKTQEDMQLHDHSSVEFSRWSSSGDPNRNHKDDLVDFIRSELDTLETDNLPSEYLFTADDSDETEAPPSGVNQQHPSEHVNHYSVVQREEAKTTTYNQGSIDDSFFFNTELAPTEVLEVRQLTDEEYEERRNFEQMQKRIEAFKRFYDNSDEENGRVERQIKVQFCDDPLSQIIRYETDSSDTESFSSSSDREEEEEEEEEENEVEEVVGQDEEIVEENEKEEKKVMEEDEEKVEEDKDDKAKEGEEVEESEDEEENEEEEDEEKVEEDKDDKAKEGEEVEENEDEEENEEEEDEESDEENEESPSSTEIFDDLMDSDDSLQINPECDPLNIQLQEKMSEVRDTHTFPKTHKGFSVLKMMIKLGVMTTMGLLMFWLISDQPDFLRDLFSV